jgi:hypothetical protein
MDSIQPWKLPLMIAAILVPGAAGFFLGDAGIGKVVGVGLGLGIVLAAGCRAPRTALVSAAAGDRRDYLLAVVGSGSDDAAVAARIRGTLARREHPEQAVVRLVAPIRAGFLARWSSDLDQARAVAQRKLHVIATTLAEAGIAVDARVGDENVVQAVEDEINSFPATEVVLLTSLGEDAAKVRAIAEELRSRLVASFGHVVVAGDAPLPATPVRGVELAPRSVA